MRWLAGNTFSLSLTESVTLDKHIWLGLDHFTADSMSLGSGLSLEMINIPSIIARRGRGITRRQFTVIVACSPFSWGGGFPAQDRLHRTWHPSGCPGSYLGKLCLLEGDDLCTVYYIRSMNLYHYRYCSRF
ncbi:hypothetical protein BDM02DRAFT_245878 [Thelephora ganbajun]|uniref:Uncharacterized protein n=1 Tax=Thelephora ganbajun TaxID=370292 RepID=A0ACB6ZQX7_THEGA|nr:hypothetical protein BDM02DRAFT_245878 [Thelephora ganbajun]